MIFHQNLVSKTALLTALALFVEGAGAQGLLGRGLSRPSSSGVLTVPGEERKISMPAINGGNQNGPIGALSNFRGAQGAQGAESPQGVAENKDGSFTIKDAAVDMVLQMYGDLVGKTIIKDPALPTSATLTLISKAGQVLSDDDKMLAIETVLEMNGVHLEPYGEKFIRALPRGTVRKDGIPLIMDSDAELGESSRVVSLMMTFQHIALDEAQKALEGLKSDKGQLNVFERMNAILVTDTEMNINRMREIARKMDVSTPVTEQVFVRQVNYASAQDIKTVIDGIVQESQKELEKQGPQANNMQQQMQMRMFMQQNNQPRTLINGRPVQNNSASNESLVTSVSDADRGMIRGKVLTLADERSNKLIIITAKPNMDFFDKVIEQLDVETTPDIVVKVYRLKYADSEDVADMINDLIGNASSSKNSSRGNQNQNSRNGTNVNMTRSYSSQQQVKKSVNQRTGEAKTGELSKENTTVLSDKRINGLVVMTNKELVPTIEQIIESMDIKLSQVLIETCIIEVQLGDDLTSGIDWVQKGRQKTMVDHSVRNGFAEDRFYAYNKNGSLSNRGFTEREFSTLKDSYSERGIDFPFGDELSEVFEKSSRVARDGLLNYTTAGAFGVGGGANGGSEAFALASGVSSNLLSKSFSFVFDSDKLGLSTILHASQSDSRSKYIASPVIMTLDNKEAVINATQMRYLLKGFTSSGNSYSTIAVPDYEQKELGIEIKTTPKINPNGTVMLTVEEKYTQLGANQTIQYSSSNGQSGGGSLQDVAVPTTITREMSSDVLLENGQTVVFAGLTDKTITESESGIPFLKDIPWIGKWLFSSVEKSETRTELLVFMTPYVLDDAEAAQAEALRRKKTMADPRPWDDDGWSLSPLADPVSRKEQIRRLKEEAKKQDEERKSKIAIEQWKVERAKALQNMTKEERNLWLEMHKDELEGEEKKEFKEKMLDPESQEELKKLAEQIRLKKLATAEAELKKMEDITKAENEHSKAEAEKAAEPVKPSEPAQEPAKPEESAKPEAQEPELKKLNEEVK